MNRPRTKTPAADGPPVVEGKPAPLEPLTKVEAKAAAVVSTAVEMLPPSTWVRRWTVIKLMLALFAGFDIAVVVQILRTGVTDSPILVHIFITSTTAIMAIVSAYVFGAVIDDNATKNAVANITTGMAQK